MQRTIKVLYAISFLAVIATATFENHCPKIQVEDWEIEALLPHRDCDKFYQCAHGQPVEMACPKGLFFNTTTNICDWRDNVDCGDRNIPEEEGADFLPNGCPVDPDIKWLLPHKRSCSYFYYCNKGKRELKRCPLGLHFNKELQICDWRWNAGCWLANLNEEEQEQFQISGE